MKTQRLVREISLMKEFLMQQRRLVGRKTSPECTHNPTLEPENMICEVRWQERMRFANGTDNKRREQSQAERKMQKNIGTARFVSQMVGCNHQLRMWKPLCARRGII